LGGMSSNDEEGMDTTEANTLACRRQIGMGRTKWTTTREGTRANEVWIVPFLNV
jgi:hypothetical protein